MKLKKLLKESNVWDRKFGEALPTLKDTTAKYAAKQNLTEKTGGHKTYKSLMKLEKGIKELESSFLKDKRDMEPDRAKNIRKSIFGIQSAWNDIWADFQER